MQEIHIPDLNDNHFAAEGFQHASHRRQAELVDVFMADRQVPAGNGFEPRELDGHFDVKQTIGKATVERVTTGAQGMSDMLQDVKTLDAVEAVVLFRICHFRSDFMNRGIDAIRSRLDASFASSVIQ